MDSQTCSMCNAEKRVKKSYKKYAECEGCNKKKELKR